MFGIFDSFLIFFFCFRLKLVAFKAVFNIIYSAVAYIVCKCVGVDGFLTHIVEMRKFVQQVS